MNREGHLRTERCSRLVPEDGTCAGRIGLVLIATRDQDEMAVAVGDAREVTELGGAEIGVCENDPRRPGERPAGHGEVLTLARRESKVDQIPCYCVPPLEVTVDSDLSDEGVQMAHLHRHVQR